MTPCDHLTAGAYPLEIDLTLDEHLGFTDALTHCRDCGQPYLLELLDWRDGLRLFRMSMPSPAHAQQLVHNLTRGSCDLRRAGAEVQNLQTASPFQRKLLLIDTAVPAIRGLVDAGTLPLPTASWRKLPCDGTWFDQLRV